MTALPPADTHGVVSLSMRQPPKRILRSGFMAHYSAGARAGLAAGFGAPMRNLLSNSDNAPPNIITTAPNQMSSTMACSKV